MQKIGDDWSVLRVGDKVVISNNENEERLVGVVRRYNAAITNTGQSVNVNVPSLGTSVIVYDDTYPWRITEYEPLEVPRLEDDLSMILVDGRELWSRIDGTRKFTTVTKTYSWEDIFRSYSSIDFVRLEKVK